MTLRTGALNDIDHERNRQDEKWGVQDHHPLGWLTILMEEVGESCKAVLEDAPTQYRKELVEVAAVAIAAIEAFDRSGYGVISLGVGHQGFRWASTKPRDTVESDQQEKSPEDPRLECLKELRNKVVTTYHGSHRGAARDAALFYCDVLTLIDAKVKKLKGED